MSTSAPVSVAVDVMGADGGSDLCLEACRQALQSDAALMILAAGEQALIEQRLAAWPSTLAARIEILPAEGVLPADAGAASALRRGQGSSMAVALNAVAERQASAAVSAGSTAALMVLARQILGMLPGIDRPALMAAFPTARDRCWMLDLGANIQVDAERLCQFARLGHVALTALNQVRPRTYLLNIGSEPGKGPDAIREAGRLLSADPEIDYLGFIEADRVFDGEADLIVCDGFSGNVLLKSAEGAMRLMFGEIKARFSGSLCGLIARPRLRQLHDSLHPAGHNGAPLLGVRGTVIKSHGGASAAGFAHAIGLARLEAQRNLSGAMAARLWAEDWPSS
ncbi:MAG: phosphate acyltransferase PlsX [Wenzhouxiangella sp.]